MATTQDIANCLSLTLNQDTTTRIKAELQLAEYLAISEAGLAISQVILAQDADLALRQHTASIVLRKFVNERWSPYFPKFKGSAPSVEIKAQVRENILKGLSDPNRKIRSLCAHTMSSIANCDWPDEYPELLPSLISLLSTGSPDSVHGAMQVFTEFIKSDLTEDQILPVLRQLLPVLLEILGSSKHTSLTRSRTVSVFRQCVTALFMVKDQHPQAVKEATASVLPVWLEAFRVLLNIDPTQDVMSEGTWDGLVVRIQIFKTLDALHTSFPRVLIPHLPDLLNPALSHLTTLYATFNHYYLSHTDATAPKSSEDESIELAQLICPILDFVGAVARGGKARDWFSSGNEGTLISAVFNYIQMTNIDEEAWLSDPNAFVAQEEDETQPYSVRVAGFDLLATLMDRERVRTAATLQATVQQVVLLSNQARESGSVNWWRPLEATLAAIGSQAEAILDCVDDEVDAERPKPIDIEQLLTQVVPSLLALSAFPFLQGRAFVFASQYAKLLPVELAGQYLSAAVEVVESSEGNVPVKISAVKAINNFCQDGSDQTLLSFVPRIAKDLGPFLLATSDDTLSLVLETLSVVVGVEKGKWVTPELADSLVVAILEVWSKNNKDPILLSMLTDMLTTLSSSPTPGIYETVVKRALPPLASAIASASQGESWIAGSAIELVSALVEGAPESGLGEGFFNLLAAGLFKCLGVAEDRDVLQNGVVALTLVIRKDCSQLISWTDASGRPGLDNVLAVVAKLLKNQDESGGLVIGDLIIHLLRRAGENILPVLPELLQAMVGRMLAAQTATFIQSLVIPFAFLINNQPETIITLLESTNVEGRSGLDIFIHTWCENAETFQGFWPSRISTLALCKLFTLERPTLQNLKVKGDIIVKPETSNVIMTRSKTKATPHEFTSITFPVKAVKLLLHDIQLKGESAHIGAQADDFVNEVDSDDGDEQWNDEEKLNQGPKEDEFGFLSDMIGPKGMAFDNDDLLDDDDDDDLKKDPVSTMDMQEFLLTFLRECAQKNTNNFSGVVDQLKAEELAVIQAVVTMQQ